MEPSDDMMKLHDWLSHKVGQLFHAQMIVAVSLAYVAYTCTHARIFHFVKAVSD
jgi:hypothetical protein